MIVRKSTYRALEAKLLDVVNESRRERADAAHRLHSLDAELAALKRELVVTEKWLDEARRERDAARSEAREDRARSEVLRERDEGNMARWQALMSQPDEPPVEGAVSVAAFGDRLNEVFGGTYTPPDAGTLPAPAAVEE
jgi:chromosome segregation ATPase